MPKVGKKHFSYSAKGIEKARDYAKKSGKSMTFKKGGTIKKNTPLSVKKKGGATPGMRKGGGLKKDKNGRFYR